jgi:hypothetical protein
MPRDPFVMSAPHQILAEGRDAELFCVHVARAYGVSGVQVRDFGGITDARLSDLLDDTRTDDFFPSVKSIIIARDAETSFEGAFQSARKRLRDSGFPAPDRPYELCGDSLKVGIVIFSPDPSGAAGVSGGTLEDMCLASVSTDPLLECVDKYLECARSKNEAKHQFHKCRLYAFLSCKEKRAGQKLAEAAHHGAFDLDHDAFRPLKQLFESLKPL